jgi:hypothetical protein
MSVTFTIIMFTFASKSSLIMSHLELDSDSSQSISGAGASDYDSDILEDKTPELGPNATLADYQNVCCSSFCRQSWLTFYLGVKEQAAA